MKKKVFKGVLILIIIGLFSVSLFATFSAAKPENSNTFDPNKVLETRFLNMLNHSFVYSNDFDDIDIIVNNSAVALLDKKVDDDYLEADVLNGYLFDMYGFKVDDFSKINDGFKFKEGYAYISPMGYATYKHEAVDLKTNPDGTYTFLTNVEIKTHDQQVILTTAETVFVKNSESVFGFNIVVSNLK